MVAAMSGQLFVVATPIGNLGDITRRAIETLRSADLIICEDTRRTENLLRYLGFQKTLMRYDDHVHVRVCTAILKKLDDGKNIALVTDAGTPGISDPGARLVSEAIKKGFSVVPIPGPSSPIAALSASGIMGDGFVFLGFLPRKKGPATRVLREAMGLGKTVVVMESPFRASATVELVADINPQVRLIVARELTKMHEEFIRGDATQVKEQLKSRPLKGESIILIDPNTP
jgi:16S rRNA (cytidine1402-2'-O)-methyltransferase